MKKLDLTKNLVTGDGSESFHGKESSSPFVVTGCRTTQNTVGLAVDTVDQGVPLRTNVELGMWELMNAVL